MTTPAPPTLELVQIHKDPYPWWRVVQPDAHHTWGSGETPAEAWADAAKELKRRGMAAQIRGTDTH